MENGQIIVSVVNSSENPVEYVLPKLESLQCNIFEGASVNLCSNTVQSVHQAEHSDTSTINMYNITPFLDHQGIYYEPHGIEHVSHITWDLVTYVDLSVCISKYSMIMSQYKATT